MCHKKYSWSACDNCVPSFHRASATPMNCLLEKNNFSLGVEYCALTAQETQWLHSRSDSLREDMWTMCSECETYAHLFYKTQLCEEDQMKTWIFVLWFPMMIEFSIMICVTTEFYRELKMTNRMIRICMCVSVHVFCGPLLT